MPTLYAIACLNGNTIRRTYENVDKPYLVNIISRVRNPNPTSSGTLINPSEQYRTALVFEGALNIRMKYDEPFSELEEGCNPIQSTILYTVFCNSNREIERKQFSDLDTATIIELLTNVGATNIVVDFSEERIRRTILFCGPRTPEPSPETPRNPRTIESERSPQIPQNPDTFFGVSSFSGASSNISEGVNFSIDNRFQATDGMGDMLNPVSNSTGTFTIYGIFCQNGTAQSLSREFPISKSSTDADLEVYNEISNLSGVSIQSIKTSNSPIPLFTIDCSSFASPTNPVNITLYIGYCDKGQPKILTRTISVISEADRNNKIAEIQTEYRSIDSNAKVEREPFTPPSCFSKSKTLYVTYCTTSGAIESSVTIQYNNESELEAKKINYETTARNLGFGNGLATSYDVKPVKAICGTGTGSPPSTFRKVNVKYCEDGIIKNYDVASSYILFDGSESNFNAKLQEFKSKELNQKSFLVKGKYTLAIDKEPENPVCIPDTRTIYVVHCQGGVVKRIDPKPLYYDGNQPALTQKALDDFLSPYRNLPGFNYKFDSYPSDPTCGSSGGGGGGNLEEGTLRVQVQFIEDGRVLNAESFSIPTVTVSNNKTRLSVPNFKDATLSQLGPLASSYTYEIANKNYFNNSTSINTLTFSPVSGWDTPRDYTFTINRAEDNVPPGRREFGSYVRVTYTRTTDTTGTGGSGPDGPGPDGPGPDGPGPTPPPPTTTFRPTTTTLRPTTTTTTRFIPRASWLKQINPTDNRRYVFDVTEGLFSNNIRNLTTFFTGSTSENYSRYYTHVYDENPKTSLTSSIQFSIAYGHSGGSGSLDEGNKINITPTRAVYSQYRNLVLGKSNIKFNLTGRETDSIYVINYQSKRLKDRLNAGVIELNIAHLSGSQFLAGGGSISTHTGSNVKLAGNNRVLRLIDDSKISTSPDYTDVGYSYNIVSGTLENGVYNQTAPHYYGKLIPSLGVVILDGNKLDLSASFATSKASEIEGYNAIKLYKSFSGSALVQDNSGDYLGMKARRVIREYNDYYFIRVLNNEYNFTNNVSRIKSEVPDFMVYRDSDPYWKTNIGLPLIPLPVDPTSLQGLEDIRRRTLLKLEKGEITEPFENNSQVYITTVGLYNAQRELIAVGKLPKPILKNFTEESIFTVKLKY